MKGSPSTQELLQWYRALLLPRLVEEQMLLMLRRGWISKWFSGVGQEAIAVGATLALDEDEYILPLHRNLGVFTTRNIPLRRLFAQFRGTSLGFTQGRDRSFHFGSQEHHIVGMISHLGPHYTVANGIALSHRLRGEEKVVLAIGGDGMTSEGDFHEALNVASVWKLPVIFIIENNGYALSTPTENQYACISLADRAVGYGMEGITIDGNDVFQVTETVSEQRQKMLESPKPVLIECLTFRRRGHEEASGVDYVPEGLFDEWQRKDPITRLENSLRDVGVLTDDLQYAIQSELQRLIEKELQMAMDDVPVLVDREKEESQILSSKKIFVGSKDRSVSESDAQEMRLIDAIRDAHFTAFEAIPELVIMGQDIGDYGGVFKVTEGLLEAYGEERVRNTPLCESAIVGAALGLAVKDIPSIVEMQFSDFSTCGFNQIMNNLAKTYYRWGIEVPVVIRMPSGAGVGAGPFHSESLESLFLHCPGLKVAFPSNPHDAKGMLLSAISDSNPVLFFEQKAMYRREKGLVPDGWYEVSDSDGGKIVQDGEDITIITYGIGVRWALEYQKAHPELSLHIVDLRWLYPLDYKLIEETTAKTNRVVVLHEAKQFLGFGSEIAAHIAEHYFHYLDAPVMRCGGMFTPVPFASELEEQYLADSKLHPTIEALLSY